MVRFRHVVDSTAAGGAVPSVSLNVFAIASGLIGLVLVWFGGFELFERISAVLVGMMFVTVVGKPRPSPFRTSARFSAD